MRKLALKLRILICVAVGLLTGAGYLALISHADAYNAYCKALFFLPQLVIDFVLPLIPPVAAGLILGANKKERRDLVFFGIAMVVILVLFALMYTARFGGLIMPE